jgi:hypothetical protein
MGSDAHDVQDTPMTGRHCRAQASLSGKSASAQFTVRELELLDDETAAAPP